MAKTTCELNRKTIVNKYLFDANIKFAEGFEKGERRANSNASE